MYSDKGLLGRAVVVVSCVDGGCGVTSSDASCCVTCGVVALCGVGCDLGGVVLGREGCFLGGVGVCILVYVVDKF